MRLRCVKHTPLFKGTLYDNKKKKILTGAINIPPMFIESQNRQDGGRGVFGTKGTVLSYTLRDRKFSYLSTICYIYMIWGSFLWSFCDEAFLDELFFFFIGYFCVFEFQKLCKSDSSKQLSIWNCLMSITPLSLFYN